MEPVRALPPHPEPYIDLRMGLSIVGATVRDKLKGKLRICSDGSGTRASFDFRAFRFVWITGFARAGAFLTRFRTKWR